MTGSSLSMPKCRSTTMRCSGGTPSPTCATIPRKIRAKSRPPNIISTMSASTAISAALSMAPGSPWRRWTRSNMRAAAPPTSSTSGGGASPERVAAAFRLVLSDRNVRAILVNVFAGINRCDWVAEGVVKACRELNVDVPLVVRLSGTNVEAGREIIAKSGLPIISADTLADAAKAAVEAAARRPATGCSHAPDLAIRAGAPRSLRPLNSLKSTPNACFVRIFRPAERSLAFAASCFRGSLKP